MLMSINRVSGFRAGIDQVKLSRLLLQIESAVLKMIVPVRILDDYFYLGLTFFAGSIISF